MPDPTAPTVSAVIVTRNNLPYLPGCLESLEAQSLRLREAVVVDNGSSDGSLEWLRMAHPWVQVLENGENLGFARANNQGIALTTGELVLLVNSDVVLAREFTARLAAALASDPGLGWASGKLLRLSSRPASLRVIDSAGEVILRSRRMVNRGEEEIDEGQYDTPLEVFGVTAAAALYRRSMLEDIRLGDDYFDSDYFAYLEDSDLNWRAQLGGWRCLYEPRALAYHARQHAPSHSLAVRRHAWANRYLSLLKNETALNLFLALPHLLVYDGYLLLRALVKEPALIPGLLKVLRLLGPALRKRRAIQRRRRVRSRELRAWMEPEPYLQHLRSLLAGQKPRRDPARGPRATRREPRAAAP